MTYQKYVYPTQATLVLIHNIIGVSKVTAFHRSLCEMHAAYKSGNRGILADLRESIREGTHVPTCYTTSDKGLLSVTETLIGV